MQSKQITGWSQISHQFWLHVTTNRMVHVNFSAFILKHMQKFLLRTSQCVLYEKNNHLSFPSSSFNDQLLIISSILLKQAWIHTVAWLKLGCIKSCIVNYDTYIGDVNLRGGRAMIFFFLFVCFCCLQLVSAVSWYILRLDTSHCRGWLIMNFWVLIYYFQV